MSDPTDPHAFEDEVRQMLARRAADVGPADLAGDLPTDIRLALHDEPPRTARPGRWLLVAAAVLVVVVGGFLARPQADPERDQPIAAEGTATTAPERRGESSSTPYVWRDSVARSPEDSTRAFFEDVLGLTVDEVRSVAATDPDAPTVVVTIAGGDEVGVRLQGDGDRWDIVLVGYAERRAVRLPSGSVGLGDPDPVSAEEGQSFQVLIRTSSGWQSLVQPAGDLTVEPRDGARALAAVYITISADGTAGELIGNPLQEPGS